MAKRVSSSATRKHRGNCYVVAEALYHLLGGKKAGYVPMRIRHEGDTHWYILRRLLVPPIPGTSFKRRKSFQMEIRVKIDPTAKQFKTLPDYSKAVGTGFLTKRPSKKARELMKKLLWQ